MSRVFSVQFTPGQDDEFLSGGWDDTVQVIKMLADLLFRESDSLFFEWATTPDLLGTVKALLVTTLVTDTTTIVK